MYDKSITKSIVDIISQHLIEYTHFIRNHDAFDKKECLLCASVFAERLQIETLLLATQYASHNKKMDELKVFIFIILLQVSA